MSSDTFRVGLLEGTGPSLSTETRALLRTRLLALVVLVAVAMGLFLGRDLLGLGPVEGSRHVAGLGALLLGLVGLAVLLSGKVPLSLRQLRAIEIVMLTLQAAWMANN